jgi:holo-[acyl-carrier protein] synthase
VLLGLGIDVVDIARIRRILEGPPDRARRFVDRCFTTAERDYCHGARDGAARYGARFAAKEAASKALGVPPGVRWVDVEVVKGESGAPSLALHGVAAERAQRIGVRRVLVSLTHDGGIATAVVALEGGGP